MNPLVLNPEEDKKEVQENTNNIKVDTIVSTPKIPNDYIPIQLPSLGKLSAPKILHFRDYTMNDALELNVLDEDDQLSAIITVLNNMCYEDFDCANLHVKEMMHILYTIHATFISNNMEKEYYIDENLPEGNEEGQLNHPSNIGVVTIKLNKLNTKTINEDFEGHIIEKKFKEPFTFTDTVKKIKMKFRLNRVGDLLIAKEYCDKKYEDDLIRFRPLKRNIYKLQEIKDVTKRNEELDNIISENEKEYEEYRKFLITYESDYVRVLQSLQIVGINDTIFETLEEKLQAYRNNISEILWKQYNKVQNTYDFGILENYTFFCEYNQKNITRRFLFQFLDFIPNPDAEYGARFDLSFD